MEELAKKCPRCGKPSANSSNPSGRCRHHLDKLSHDKKKPGHWQRAQTKADDALRRQKGKNGTASKKSSGLGSRASIVRQTKSAEKKTGQKLSPDRKNNSKGYAASNTRMVPEKLNRGRHHVDGKKLRAWQKRLKKSETSYEEFYTYLLAKANETNDTALLSLLEEMHYSDVANFIEKEDLEKTYINKKIAPGACDCGAHKTNSEMHSDWCGGLKAATPHPHAATKDFLANLSASGAKKFGTKSPDVIVGNHELMEPGDGIPFDDFKPDSDVAIQYDFGDTHDPDHPGYKDYHSFDTHMDNQQDAVKEHMDNRGYEPIDDMDGSGNGLNYGVTHFRKKKT